MALRKQQHEFALDRTIRGHPIFGSLYPKYCYVLPKVHNIVWPANNSISIYYMLMRWVCRDEVKWWWKWIAASLLRLCIWWCFFVNTEWQFPHTVYKVLCSSYVGCVCVAYAWEAKNQYEYLMEEARECMHFPFPHQPKGRRFNREHSLA